jgi:16S rRNA (guanine527-N7)-methyltransferase
VKVDIKLLREGLEILGIEASGCRDAFVEYLDLLQKWNRIYNLTAICHPDDRVVKHLFDSLAVRPYLLGQRIIDVGTGAGFPGIPLAIVEPRRQFVLLDSQIKKVNFLLAVKSALGLTHVKVVHARVEDFSPEVFFDTVLTRAFASLESIWEKTRHLAGQGGQFLAMKGQYPLGELEGLTENDWKIHVLNVPFLNEKRHLVQFSKKNGVVA